MQAGSQISALLRKRIEEDYDVYALVDTVHGVIGICSSRHQAERLRAILGNKRYTVKIQPWQLDKTFSGGVAA